MKRSSREIVRENDKERKREKNTEHDKLKTKKTIKID